MKKNIDLEIRFSRAIAPLLAASKEHEEKVLGLIHKIERSNGQIKRALCDSSGVCNREQKI